MIRVVFWQRRDGSVSAEVRVVSLPAGGAPGELVSHAAAHDLGSRFTTICGINWFGMLSAYGLRTPDVIDCPACRELLAGQEAVIA